MIHPLIDVILSFVFGAGGSGIIYYFLDKNKRREETKNIKAEALEKMQKVYDEFVEDYEKKYTQMKQDYDNLRKEFDKVKQDFEEHKKRCKNCKTN